MSKGLFGRLQAEVVAREKNPGLDMAEILDLPDSEREIINWMLRETYVSFAQLTKRMAKGESSARSMLDSFLDKGYVREIEMKGEVLYRVRLKPKRKHNMPSNLWKALENKTDK